MRLRLDQKDRGVRSFVARLPPSPWSVGEVCSRRVEFRTSFRDLSSGDGRSQPNLEIELLGNGKLPTFHFPRTPSGHRPDRTGRQGPKAGCDLKGQSRFSPGNGKTSAFHFPRKSWSRRPDQKGRHNIVPGFCHGRSQIPQSGSRGMESFPFSVNANETPA